jgi:hypothetical protein
MNGTAPSPARPGSTPAPMTSSAASAGGPAGVRELLTRRFPGLETDADGQKLVWFDGPSVPDVATFLAGHGYDLNHDYVTAPDGEILLLARRLRTTTTIAYVLQHPACSPGATLAAHTLPVGGLHPESLVDRVAATLVHDQIREACHAGDHDSVYALGPAVKALDALGGPATLRTIAELAAR